MVIWGGIKYVNFMSKERYYCKYRISDEIGAIAIQHGFIYEMPEK